MAVGLFDFKRDFQTTSLVLSAMCLALQTFERGSLKIQLIGSERESCFVVGRLLSLLLRELY